MNVETLAQYKALHHAYISGNPGIVDMLLAGELKVGDGQMPSDLPLKRIQFDAWIGLSEELEQVCQLLEVSKREFCEVALVEALHKAKTKFFDAYRDATGEEFGEPVASQGKN
jgi:hypothetical protein